MPKRNLRMDRGSIRDFEKNLRRTRDSVIESVSSFLTKHAEGVIETASNYYVPIWTGALVYSNWIDEVVVGEENIRITFGFADPEKHMINPETGVPVTQYAIEVHEHGSPLYPRPHKYLEIPVTESLKHFEQGLNEAIAEGLAARRVGG